MASSHHQSEQRVVSGTVQFCSAWRRGWVDVSGCCRGLEIEFPISGLRCQVSWYSEATKQEESANENAQRCHLRFRLCRQHCCHLLGPRESKAAGDRGS